MNSLSHGTLCLSHLPCWQLYEEAVWHSSRDSWKGSGDHQSSTPDPYHLFPYCGWGFSELPVGLSVQALPNPLLSRGIITIANYFEETLTKCAVHHLNGARSWDCAGLALQWCCKTEGLLFTHLHSNHNSLAEHRLCLQLQTLPTHQLETTSGNEGNRAKAKGKAMLLLEVFLKWKSKISQQRGFQRQDG